MTGLDLEFCGERRRLTPGVELVFGRGSTVDLHIDDNPQLHRRFGAIRHHDGGWWLHNLGSRLLLHVHDRTSKSSAAVAPGTAAPLVYPAIAVRFTAGVATYELVLDLDLDVAGAVADAVPGAADRTASPPTVDHSDLPLTPNQRLLLVALAEPALNDPTGPVSIPANKSVASRLGWSTTTFNRALDRLCRKLDRAGVAGLVGAPGDLATDRRRRLVEHAVTTELVTEADLSLLPSTGGPRP